MAQFSSMHMQMVVTPFLVFELTGSYAKLGLMAFASAVPALVLGFFGGVVADRAPKLLVVQIGQALNMLTTLLLAFLLVAGVVRFDHLLLVSAAQGAVFAMMGPARQALIPEIVGPQRLTNAIALNMAGLNVTRMGMPALGGLLIAWVSPAAAYFVMAGMLALSIVGLSRVTKYEPLPGEELLTPPIPLHAMPVQPAGASASVTGALRDVVDGARYAMKDRTILTLLVVNFFIVLMSMPYMQMLAGFVKEVLGAGPTLLGVLWSISGIGSLAGSLAVASMGNSGRGRAYLLSAVLLGLALMAFAASHWLWITAATMVLIGVGQAGRMSLSNVLLMEYTAPAYQGRVMSFYMMEFSLVSFGTFLVGMLASVVGIQWAIGTTAISLLAIGLLGLLLVPRVRDLP